MARDLRERYESFWTAWTGLFRMTRMQAIPKALSRSPARRFTDSSYCSTSMPAWYST
jgi:hypothetical protein